MGPAFKVEIHGKKGQIGNDIDLTQAVVKFDAVDHLDTRLWKGVDVTCSQIAMTVPNPAAFGTVVKQIAPAVQKSTRR